MRQLNPLMRKSKPSEHRYGVSLMKSSFCIDLQRFMLIPTKFPLV